MTGGYKVTRRSGLPSVEGPDFQAGKFYEDGETGDLVYAASYTPWVDDKFRAVFRERYALVAIGGENHGYALDGIAKPRHKYREVEVEVIY